MGLVVARARPVLALTAALGEQSTEPTTHVRSSASHSSHGSHSGPTVDLHHLTAFAGQGNPLVIERGRCRNPRTCIDWLRLHLGRIRVGGETHKVRAVACVNGQQHVPAVRIDRGQSGQLCKRQRCPTADLTVLTVHLHQHRTRLIPIRVDHQQQRPTGTEHVSDPTAKIGGQTPRLRLLARRSNQIRDLDRPHRVIGQGDNHLASAIESPRVHVLHSRSGLDTSERLRVTAVADEVIHAIHQDTILLGRRQVAVVIKQRQVIRRVIAR